MWILQLQYMRTEESTLNLVTLLHRTWVSTSNIFLSYLDDFLHQYKIYIQTYTFLCMWNVYCDI